MRCRPSEVMDEDEADIQLWQLWDKVESLVSKRERDRQQNAAKRNRGR